MPTTEHATSGTTTVPDVVLFATGARTVTAADLIAIARADGRWDRVTAHAARADAALAAAGDLPADEVRAAERSFRYARGLVAAEDVDAWLSQFAISVRAWRAQIRREVALERHPDVEGDVADDATAWVAACCTGLLATLAQDQAQRVAAAAALDEDAEVPAADVVARFLERAVDDTDIDRELSDNAMDWLRVRYAVLAAPTIDAAAEARLCLVEDGMSPVEVADLLGSPLIEREVWLRDAPEGMGDVLLTTDIGGASAPLSVDGGAHIVTVAARDRLAREDGTLRGAVREVLAQRALARQVEDRVRWHVRF